MNKKIIILSITLLSAFFTGCASKEYNQNMANIINHSLSNNKISSAHLKCFKCETNFWPKSVNELKEFKPTVNECKNVFKNSALTEADHIPNAVIFMKQTDLKVSLLIARPGINFENISMKDNFISKSFNRSELDCSYKF